jgi:hypothetical protein
MLANYLSPTRLEFMRSLSLTMNVASASLNLHSIIAHP